MNFKKLFATVLTITATFSATSCDFLHTHTYEDTYSFNETHHWKQATCCDVIGNEKEHDLANGKCSTCDYEIPEASFSHEVFGVGVDKTITLSTANTAHVKSVAYSSTSDNITINHENNTVLGVSLGRAEVSATVTYTDGSTSTASCQVEVNDGSYQSLNMQENFVKWVGRNFVYQNAVNCFNTASGFEVTFYGTSLKAEITSAGSQTPRICVLIDEETSPAKKVIDLTKTKTTQEVILADGLQEGYHTVKVYKITEASHNSMAVKSMQTDGFFYTKPQENELKIEFYGDSITTGYLNLREVIDESGVSNEKMQNGCLTYAWLAAQSLNAEISVMARAGIGMNYSYGVNYFMKNAWSQTYCSEKDFLGYNNYNPNWNFENYTADVVVINIGSTDYWGPATNYATFQQDVSYLCRDLIKKHGEDLKIVLAYGMMTVGNGADLEAIADKHDNVYAIQLEQSLEDHPRSFEHAISAKTLAKFIQEKVLPM